MVKITATDDIISFLIVCFHILVEHGKLSVPDGSICPVCRKMYIIKTEALSVFQRDP